MTICFSRNNPWTLADSGFFKNFLYQGGVKSTGSWVFEDLKFKISEGYDQNFGSEPSEIVNFMWNPLLPMPPHFWGIIIQS